MYRLSPTPAQMQAAALVAESAALESVRVATLRAENAIDPKSFTGKLPTHLAFKMHQFAVPREGNLEVELQLVLSIGAPEGVADAVTPGTARIEIHLVAEYRIPLGPVPAVIETEGFPAFAEFNGLFNCWPYFRQQLQQATANMGLPTFVLAPLTVRTASPEAANAPAKRAGGRSRKAEIASANPKPKVT